MKASITNHRQAPRKVRLVGNLLKGKSVTDAKAILRSLNKKAALPLEKLLKSAIDNAAQRGVTAENLFVKDLRVDTGMVFKRIMPRARGRGALIRKESSHVILALEVGQPPKKGRNPSSRAKLATGQAAKLTPKT